MVFQKARNLFLGNANDLMDKVIDLNSPGSVRQYIRDLENAKEDLEDSSANANGYVRNLVRQVGELEARTQQLDRDIDFILTDGNPDNDGLATGFQADFDGLEQELEDKRQEMAAAEEAAENLTVVVSKLQSRHREMVNQLRSLESLDKATKAKSQAAEAIRHAASVGGAVSVDNVVQRMRRDADVADARLEQAMGTMTDSPKEQLALARAQSNLEARKARLAGKASAPAS